MVTHYYGKVLEDDMNRNLLHTPEGVRDIYGHECSDRCQVKHAISRKMQSFGFEEIDTPSFEFFDVFAREISNNSAMELYKFFDNEGRTMVLRPDFTPSVARCVSKYFLTENEPVRFYYSGKTFLNTHNLQGKLKENTEMGAELMNEPSVYADAEMIALLVQSLKETGLDDFKVSIGDADYYLGICDEACIGKDLEADIREHMVSRNSFAADLVMQQAGVSEKYRQLIQNVATFIGDSSILDEAARLVNNVRSNNAIARLQELYKVLCSYGIKKYISFDLGLLSKFNYYTGVIFGAYTYGVGDAIARGGRYDNLLEKFGKSAPAIGFMINIDELMKALYSQKVKISDGDEAIVIEYTASDFDESLKKADQLRNQGKKVILKERTKK